MSNQSKEKCADPFCENPNAEWTDEGFERSTVCMKEKEERDAMLARTDRAVRSAGYGAETTDDEDFKAHKAAVQVIDYKDLCGPQSDEEWEASLGGEHATSAGYKEFARLAR